MSDATARREYQRTHWGERGRDRVSVGRAANPAHGTLTKMGRLHDVTYEADKGDGLQLYQHEFNADDPKPAKLVYNEGGLIIVDGDYTIEEGGIKG